MPDRLADDVLTVRERNDLDGVWDSSNPNTDNLGLAEHADERQEKDEHCGQDYSLALGTIPSLSLESDAERQRCKFGSLSSFTQPHFHASNLTICVLESRESFEKSECHSCCPRWKNLEFRGKS